MFFFFDMQFAVGFSINAIHVPRHEYCNKTGPTLCAGGGLYSF